MTDSQTCARPRHHRWCLLFPFVWQAGFAPLVNDVELRPFEMPFPMAWQLLGIALTSVVIGWIFLQDAKIDAGDVAASGTATNFGRARD